MIILSAFLFYRIACPTACNAEIRFTFCFRLQYVKERLRDTVAHGWKPEGLDLSAGPVPAFPPYVTETRELQHTPQATCEPGRTVTNGHVFFLSFVFCVLALALACADTLQKGGVPAAPSGTATLLRLSPNHQFCLRPILAVTDFRHPRLSWLDGRCVQGPGTYSPRHG